MSALIRQPIEREPDSRTRIDTVTAVLGTIATGIMSGALIAHDIKRVILGACAALQDLGTAPVTVEIQKATPGAAVVTIGTCTLGGVGTDDTATSPVAFTFTDTAIAVNDSVTFKVTDAGADGANLLVRMDTARNYA